MTMDITAIILAIISFLSGLGWMLDRKKHRQEVEALRADVKQKELDLSRDYVTEWRTYIAEPLQREVGRAFCAFVHDPFETDKSCKVLSIKASRNGACKFAAIIRLVAPVTSCI